MFPPIGACPCRGPSEAVRRGRSLHSSEHLRSALGGQGIGRTGEGVETTVLNREDDAAPGEQPARRAAYADLVAAVLDLRSPVATATFDRALSAALAAGTLTEELARELRWLQRESVRDVVTHASNVLPATLVALDRHVAPDPGLDVQDERRADAPADATASPAEPTPLAEEREDAAAEAGWDDGDTGAQEPPEEAEESPTPVDLTARRLLVAGLRPIPDPPFP